MKNKFLATCAFLGAASFSLATLTSCDIDDINLGSILDGATGCQNLDTKYEEAVRSEGELITIQQLKDGMKDGTVGFSMSLLLNKEGVNKLFRAASDFTKYSYKGDGYTLTLKVPTIQLSGCPKSQLMAIYNELQKDVGYYSNYFAYDYYAQQMREDNEVSCITMDLPVEVQVPILGKTTQKITVALPIYSKIKGDDPANEADYAKGLRTSIFADLKHAQLIEFGALENIPVVGSYIIPAINLIWQEFQVGNAVLKKKLFGSL